MAETLDAETRQDIWEGVQDSPEATAFAWKQENPWLPLTAISNAKWVYRTLTESGAEHPKDWPEAFALAKSEAHQSAAQRLSDEDKDPSNNHTAYVNAAERGMSRKKKPGKTLTRRFLDNQTRTNTN